MCLSLLEIETCRGSALVSSVRIRSLLKSPAEYTVWGITWYSNTSERNAGHFHFHFTCSFDQYNTQFIQKRISIYVPLSIFGSFSSFWTAAAPSLANAALLGAKTVRLSPVKTNPQCNTYYLDQITKFYKYMDKSTKNVSKNIEL